MTAARVILVVIHNPRNAELLSAFLEKRGYAAVVAGSMDEFDRLIDSDARYNLALIDVSGFDKDVWIRCGRLRAASVPFLVISSPIHTIDTEQSIRHGATGTLTKPVAMKELANLIDMLVR